MSIIKKLLVVAAVMLLWAGMVHAQTQNPTTITPTVNPSNAILPPCDSTNPNADCYTLLEALPTSDPTKDITSIDVNGTGNSEGIGGFINFAMELGIGIAGILGVVMLVVYGFQYAANDQNVGNFEVVKGKITKVVLGLMLLLGITIILRTINPDLLIVEPGINTQYLDTEEAGDGATDGVYTADRPVSTQTTIKSCPAGTTVVYGINVCKTIAPNLKAMIDAARASGVVLGGGGFRTAAQQIALRNSNCSCGGNQQCINTKRASQCRPPTARPGLSRHESGLAIDFTCSNLGIINVSKRPGTKVCFDWMRLNASKYGFKNLPSENWHWSIDGK